MLCFFFYFIISFFALYFIPNWLKRPNLIIIRSKYNLTGESHPYHCVVLWFQTLKISLFEELTEGWKPIATKFRRDKKPDAKFLDKEISVF